MKRLVINNWIRFKTRSILFFNKYKQALTIGVLGGMVVIQIITLARVDSTAKSTKQTQEQIKQQIDADVVSKENARARANARQVQILLDIRCLFKQFIAYQDLPTFQMQAEKNCPLKEVDEKGNLVNGAFTPEPSTAPQTEDSPKPTPEQPNEPQNPSEKPSSILPGVEECIISNITINGGCI